eukprot:SAG31_NODE_15297_length_762_cov_0.769231_1_plen_154_part_01
MEHTIDAKAKVFTAYAAAVRHSGERMPLASGIPLADEARHSFADECRKQQLAPLAVLPAPYLFGEKEAGEVNLSNRHVGSGMVKALAKALVALPKGCRLQKLNLSGNGLDSEATCAMCPVIQKHTASLGVLNLSGNKLGTHGCTALATALAGNI